MTILTFANGKRFVGNRPWADVILEPTYIPTPNTHKCLVDTGADYLLLPASARKGAGLLARPTTIHTSKTAGGVATFDLMTGVEVEIEGYTVTIDVLFDPKNAATPLAGRNLLLAAFEIGFQSSDWHWT